MSQINSSLTNDEVLVILRQDIANLRDEIIKGNEETKKELEEANIKISRLEQDNEQLAKRVNYLEQKNRKNNIILFGAENSDRDLIEISNEVFNKHLGVEIKETDINSIYKLNRNNIKNTSVPIKIELISNIKKRSLFKNANRLKNTTYAISNDMSKAEREERKKLNFHLKNARSKNLNAVMRRDSLIINGEEFKSNTLSGDDEVFTSIEISDPKQDINESQRKKCPEQAKNLKPKSSSTKTPTLIFNNMVKNMDSAKTRGPLTRNRKQ